MASEEQVEQIGSEDNQAHEPHPGFAWLAYSVLIILGGLLILFAIVFRPGNVPTENLYVILLLVALFVAWLYAAISRCYQAKAGKMTRQSLAEWWAGYFQNTSNAVLTSIFLGLVIYVSIDYNDAELARQAERERIHVAMLSASSAQTSRAYIELRNADSEFFDADEPPENTLRDPEVHLLQGADYRNLAGVNYSRLDFTGFVFNPEQSFAGSTLASATFADATLNEVDFSAANLSLVEGRGARLCESTFVDATMSRANFPSAAFSGSQFLGADMAYAGLSDVAFDNITDNGSAMNGANFFDANFYCSQFFRTDLSDTSLEDTTLNGVLFSNVSLVRSDLTLARSDLAPPPDTPTCERQPVDNTASITTMPPCRTAEGTNTLDAADERVVPPLRFVESNLTDAILRSVTMPGAEFSEIVAPRLIGSSAMLTDTRFTDVTMPYAQFPNADFTGVQMRESDLNNGTFDETIFIESRLENVTAVNASMISVDFEAATLINVDFTAAAMHIGDEPAHFRCATLQDVDFSDSDLRGAVFWGATLENVTFNRTDLTDVRFSVGGEAPTVFDNVTFDGQSVATPQDLAELTDFAVNLQEIPELSCDPEQ